MLRIEQSAEGLRAVYEQDGKEGAVTCQQVLMAAGRRTNLTGIDAHALGLQMDEKQCIVVDASQRTSIPGVYAIGDVVGGYQLAHAAYAEGEAAWQIFWARADPWEQSRYLYALIPSHALPR